MDLADRNVIITGGSSGIGKATAKLFAQRGANVAIIARRQELLDAALSELEQERRSKAQIFQSYSADLSEWDQASAAIEAVIANKRAPDVLINSAGTVRPGYFHELPIQVFRETMDVDFFGTLYPCKLVAPMMMARRRGHIINISSVAGFLGVFGYTAYSAAKFAVRGFSDVLRSELWPYGVRVSIVFPPDTSTPQLVEENKYKPLETQRLSGTIRPVEPEKVAEAIVRAIGTGRYIIAPGLQPGLFYALTNGLQGFARWHFDRVIAGARKEARLDVTEQS
jgi:3-dehydrosphinganine reductase